MNRRASPSPAVSGSSSRFLTDVIVDMGLSSRGQVEEAIESSRGLGTTPERVLLDAGALTHDGLARALAERYGLDHLDLGAFSVDMSAANLVTTTAAKRYQAVPVAFADKRTLLVAMADPSNVLAVDDIAIMTGYEVRVAVAPPDDIAGLILRLDRLDDVVAASSNSQIEEFEEGAEVVDLHETAEDAPVIKLVNQIVAQAVERGASDIHLAPDGRELRVRFRIDGVLQDVTTVQRRTAAGVVSRVKIMAELDIAERRLPQDGRVGLTVDGHHVDLRVVTLPSVHGEALVLRVLDKDSVVVDLDKLGMAEAECERFERAFHETHGAVLVTGPTGSGKSTTLYAALQRLNTAEKNIITVEDRSSMKSRASPGAGLLQGRPHVRRRPALDGSRRSRRDHGRGDPRPRDRPDRDRVRAHGPSCSRRCTPTTHPPRSPAWWRWVSSRSSSPPRSIASSLSDWRASSAPAASVARSSPPRSCAITATRRSSIWRRMSPSAAGAAVAAVTAGASGCMR